MKWSPQQQAFIDWAANGQGSCVLEAVAGSGKTTTILGSVDVIPGKSAILAYNKKIAEEIKAKLIKKGIDFKQAEAGTVHSFGFKAYRNQFPKFKVEGYKVANLIGNKKFPGIVPEAYLKYSSAIGDLVSMAKQRALGIIGSIDNDALWYDISDHFDIISGDIEEDVSKEIISLAKKVLKASNTQTDVIDYDDMVYLPLIHKVKIWPYDNVFVDEAQDTNPARRALVRALVKKGGRAIFVGDRHQAIYGFTGADADSLDLSAADFNCVRMPLTTTYRCPKAIVDFARQWVSHIEAHESAPEGKLSTETYEGFLKRNDLNGEAAVLCRNTAPLVKLAFTMIRNRIPCRVEGREIGKGLVKLVTRWSTIKTTEGLVSRLEEYVDREVAKALSKKQESKAQMIEDQIATIKIIIGHCNQDKKNQISDVVAAINTLFEDNVSGILTLSTIHKSKGREWKRVFWLDRRGTCPSKYARQAWQMEQEGHLCYVAATRAMDELIELAPPTTG